MEGLGRGVLIISGESVCPICERELGELWDDHHLVPRSKKGKEVVRIHKVCHSKIHKTFSIKELADYYHTVERLRAHEEIAKYIKWISKKDPMFYSKNFDTHERRSKRRRNRNG